LEFAIVFPVLMLTIFLTGFFFTLFFSNWSAARSVEWLGNKITTTGVFNDSTRTAWQTASASFGTAIDPVNDVITIRVIGASDTVDYHWNDNDVTTSYGDMVTVSITRTMSFPVLSNLVNGLGSGASTVKASWSGISQLNTAGAGDFVIPPAQNGDIRGMVIVRRSSGVPAVLPCVLVRSSPPTYIIDCPPTNPVTVSAGTSSATSSDGSDGRLIGSYALSGVPAGNQTLSASGPAISSATIAITVVAGQTTYQDITTTDR
jgi:hypothetical protein